VPLGVQVEAPSAPGKYWVAVTTSEGTSNRKVVTVEALKYRSSPHPQIDPNFTQNPSNPLDVTFSYAAAGVVTGVYGIQDPTIGNGILIFYNNGSLACSSNVGGAVTSATCQVVYQTYGPAKTTVEYLSGTSSATESTTVEVWWTGPTTITPSDFDFYLGFADIGNLSSSANIVVALTDSRSWPAAINNGDEQLGSMTFVVNGTNVTATCMSVIPPSGVPVTYDFGNDTIGTVCTGSGLPGNEPIPTPITLTASYTGGTYTTPWLPADRNTITINAASFSNAGPVAELPPTGP
jgi:hypothetical protein